MPSPHVSIDIGKKIGARRAIVPVYGERGIGSGMVQEEMAAKTSVLAAFYKEPRFRLPEKW
ncbi:hypothetical protein GCM10008915_72430 [Bifidobacterium pullorum subsp. gallinarum]